MPGAFFTSKRFIIPVVAVVLVAAGVLMAARGAMPGDTLYPVKLSVIGKVAGLFGSTFSYTSHTLALEQSLDELVKRSYDTASTSNDNLEPLIEKAQKDATEALKDVQSQPIGTSRIDSAAALSRLTKSFKVLIDETPKFKKIGDAADAMQEPVSDELRATVAAYASTTNPEDVKHYIGTNVAEVSAEIPSVAPGSVAQKNAIARVNDANEALSEGDLAVALFSILRAEEAIAVDKYLWGFERGEEGAPVETLTDDQKNGQ